MRTTLVITPTSIVSTYCYSIFRVEPSSYCRFSCIYCYARWYRQADEKLTQAHLREFTKFLKYINNKSLHKVVPFRLSTLVDPFQDDEKCLRRSSHILRLCLRYEVPIIVNTKSTYIISDSILDLLQRLNEHRLVLVQISICTLDREVSRILEPRAPEPDQRLKAVEKLAAEDIPVVVRYQPLIPSVAEKEYDTLVQQIKSAGAAHLIVESLRADPATVKTLSSLLPSIREVVWTSYIEGLRNVLICPSRNWRVGIERAIRDVCLKNGVNFAVCKEDTFYLTTCEDCCGMYMLNRERVLKRLTALDLYRIGKVPSSMELLDRIAKEYGYMDLEYINNLPGPIRKMLRWHYKLLLKNVNRVLSITRLSDEYSPT